MELLVTTFPRMPPGYVGALFILVMVWGFYGTVFITSHKIVSFIDVTSKYYTVYVIVVTYSVTAFWCITYLFMLFYLYKLSI